MMSKNAMFCCKFPCIGLNLSTGDSNLEWGTKIHCNAENVWNYNQKLKDMSIQASQGVVKIRKHLFLAVAYIKY